MAFPLVDVFVVEIDANKDWTSQVVVAWERRTGRIEADQIAGSQYRHTSYPGSDRPHVSALSQARRVPPRQEDVSVNGLARVVEGRLIAVDLQGCGF